MKKITAYFLMTLVGEICSQGYAADFLDEKNSQLFRVQKTPQEVSNDPLSQKEWEEFFSSVYTLCCNSSLSYLKDLKDNEKKIKDKCVAYGALFSSKALKKAQRNEDTYKKYLKDVAGNITWLDGLWPQLFNPNQVMVLQKSPVKEAIDNVLSVRNRTGTYIMENHKKFTGKPLELLNSLNDLCIPCTMWIQSTGKQKVINSYLWYQEVKGEYGIFLFDTQTPLGNTKLYINQKNLFRDQKGNLRFHLFLTCFPEGSAVSVEKRSGLIFEKKKEGYSIIWYAGEEKNYEASSVNNIVSYEIHQNVQDNINAAKEFANYFKQDEVSEAKEMPSHFSGEQKK